MRSQPIGTSHFPDEPDLSKASAGKESPFEASFAALFQYVAEGAQANPSPGTRRVDGKTEKESLPLPEPSAEPAKQGMPLQQAAHALHADSHVTLPKPSPLVAPKEESPGRTPVESATKQTQSDQDAADAVAVPSVETEEIDAAKQETNPRKIPESLETASTELQTSKPIEKQVNKPAVMNAVEHHHLSQPSVHHATGIQPDQKIQVALAPDAMNQNVLSVPSLAPVEHDTKTIAAHEGVESALAPIKDARKPLIPLLASTRQISQDQSQSTLFGDEKATPSSMEEKGTESLVVVPATTVSSGAAPSLGVLRASSGETISNPAMLQGLHPVEAKTATQVTTTTERPREVFSYSTTPAEGALPHVELASNNRLLEIGVAHDTHGWLKIRAELTGNGEVSASLTGSSSSASRLRDDLPALNSYLREERVSLAELSVHAAPSLATGNESQPAANMSHMSEGRSGDTASHAHPNAQERQQQKQVSQPAIAVSVRDDSSNAASIVHGEEHRAVGWISVRA